MNWKKRVVVCKNQVHANNIFGNAPIGGVKVKNKKGEIEYLNQHPKTNWDKMLKEALLKHPGKLKR
jgi:hypothetical protein